MKQRIIMALVALNSLVAAFAGNIVAGDLTMKPGETKALEISLEGTVSNLYGIQFEVRLAEGLSFVKGQDGKVFEMAGSQVADITCKDLELGDGTYRFVVYSATLQQLQGGRLMTVNLKADDATALGNYTVTIGNVALSDLEGHVSKEDGVTVGVKVTDFFTLLYMVDGEYYNSHDVEYGAIVYPETEPTKEGYTFSGWSEIPETMPAEDVTVSSSFTINKYKVTYMLDGVEYKTFEVEYGANIPTEAAPAKEGYTFSGWIGIPDAMPAHDVTINGSFGINTYRLTYMVDGVEYKAFDLAFGAAVTPETEPKKEGYTFSGWSEVPETMPDHDVTVTGTFTINKYKLIYLIDGESYKTFEVEYGATITPEEAPTKEGHTFSGWSEIPETMPAKDITVNGSFTVNKYKLIYIVDGEEYKACEIDYGTTITPETEPAKEGYTFSGWSEIPETMPARNVVVTGSFTVNTYTLTYQVDGGEYKTYKVEYGSAITPEAEPASKEGHTFSGWSEIPETMPAHDVMVTGKFTVNKYVLIYLLDGKEYKTLEVDYGSTIVPEAEPAPKEGYTFSGWEGLPETMPAQIVVVTGTYTVNKYKLTYMIGDETYKEVEMEYGSTIPAEPQPDGDYVRFVWVGVPETMPAHDVTVYADFKTGILDVMALHGVRCIYSPNGKRISKLQKGVNIVVMNDGSVKKVYVK